MKRNDIAAIRKQFTFPPGERPASTNVVLELVTEIEQLRHSLETANKTNLELAKELAALK